MLAARVLPNVISFNCEVSFGSTIVASGKSHQWRVALLLFMDMLSTGISPNRVCYNQVLEAIVPIEIGCEIFRQALSKRTWPNMLHDNGSKIDLHDHSCGSGQLAVRWWLVEVVAERLASDRNSKAFTVVTGWGKSREAWQTGDLQEEVSHLLRDCGISCEAHPTNPGCLRVDCSAVAPSRLQALFPSVGARENKRVGRLNWYAFLCRLKKPKSSKSSM